MGRTGLRPATSADRELCYRLHRAAMHDYVEAIWGWNEAEQRDYHQRSFDPAGTRIITVDGRDVGVLIVDYRPHEIYLGRIELHPDHHNRGIGSLIIRQLLREAAIRRQPVVLDVLSVNSRAYRLYHRLGFQEVGRHGKNGLKIRLRAEPRIS